MLHSSQFFPHIYLLGGLTGSGKTELLHHLHAAGQQVLDIENLCHHDGSAFASLQYGSQPSSYTFNKKLNKIWHSFNGGKPVFIERELQKIGNLTIPDWLYQNILSAPIIWLDTDRALRIKRISGIVRQSDPVAFCDCVSKLSGRMSETVITSIIQYFSEGHVEEAVGLLLDYYDNANGYTVPQERISHRMEVVQSDMKYYCDLLLNDILHDPVPSIVS